jgi:hypothetical protein
VKSIGEESWTITARDGTDRVVTVTAATKIVGNPRVGDTVEVLGHSNPAGGFVADVIALADVTSPSDDRFEGTVKSIGRAEWVVTDRSGTDRQVGISTTTKIVGDPRVGDRVGVSGRTDAATGTFVAILIVRLDVTPPPPPMDRIEGTVKSIATTAWVITVRGGADENVGVTSQTRILGNPKVGDQVMAIGARDSAGHFVAVVIAPIGMGPF